MVFLTASAEAGRGKSADGGGLGEALAGPNDVQHVLFPARPRLEHPHLPLPDHIDPGARLIFAENHLSLAKMAQPADGGQPLEPRRLRPRRTAGNCSENVDNVHGLIQVKGEVAGTSKIAL